jgi:hypothetical protein
MLHERHTYTSEPGWESNHSTCMYKRLYEVMLYKQLKRWASRGGDAKV